MPTILIQHADGTAVFHRLVKHVTILGRDRECDLVLDATGISRRHCAIVADAEGHLMRDLQSKNGVYLGRHRVEQVRLKHGMILNLGDATLSFYDTMRARLRDSSEGDESDPASDPPDCQLSWVDAQAALLMERSDQSSDRGVELDANNDYQVVQQKLRRMERRLRTTEMRLHIMEQLAFCSTIGQLHCASAKMVLGRLPVVRLLVIHQKTLDTVDIRFVRMAQWHTSNTELAVSLRALQRLRGAMKAIALKLFPSARYAPEATQPELPLTMPDTQEVPGLPDAPPPRPAMATLTRPENREMASKGFQTLLAPLIVHGKWYGALQADYPPEARAVQGQDLEFFGEVASVLSMGLTTYGDLLEELSQRTSPEAEAGNADRPQQPDPGMTPSPFAEGAPGGG